MIMYHFGTSCTPHVFISSSHIPHIQILSFLIHTYVDFRNNGEIPIPPPCNTTDLFALRNVCKEGSLAC